MNTTLLARTISVGSLTVGLLWAATAANAATPGTAAAAPAPADTPQIAKDGEGLADIVVTGEFRKEEQQHSPVAISVVSSETLTLKGLENLRDIATRIPGLFASPTALTHSTVSYYIRGVGETDSIANQTVGTYVDDVYIARPIGGTFELNDVENIQVLRGPQGTLYGRNSSAGAIKITTATPGNETHYFAEGTLGNYNSVIIRAGASAPIVEDKLAASISYIHRQRDGTVHDVTLNKDVGKLNSDYIRAKLNFTPTDRIAFLLTGEYFHDASDPTPLINRNQPGGVDPNRNYSDVAIYNRTNLGGVSLRGTFELSDTSTIKTVTAFRAFRQPGLYDQDGSATLINRTYSFHRNENTSQEIQYLLETKRLHAVAGVFALYDNFRSYRTNYSPLASSSLLPDRTSLQNSKERTKNISVYGQATYDLTDALHVIAGARYTHESHNFDFQGNNNNGLTGAALRYLPSFYTVHVPYVSWNSFTPKLGVSYDLNARSSAYVTYSKGFKAGGFDGRANSQVAAVLPYDPETVTTWEGGIKTEFLDRKVRTNVAVFHNKINGYQATALDENAIQHRINLGEVRTQGFELEATVAPLRRLIWQSNVSFLDSKVLTTGGAASNSTTFLGKQVTNAPRWQYFTSLDYDLPIKAAGTYRVGAEFFYRSQIYTDGPNTYAARGVPQKLVNLSASYTTRGGRWQFSGNVSNLLDKRYDQGGTAGDGITTINAATYNEPRLWYLRARFNY
ncbi:TonB-dependent receptor [Sphingomonas sp. AP4-R1]|uniref:TonB-dependent receptor n=1 Tax=Sphingomonas sp. AP4-R1 TaxID=2735134 RepID=UPI00149383D6|nr:TonB-dependent receptor [Sphingomonas sp. AP4-R1]QJU57358.1 TonB-dependent receptor [Sphingomonas sp. AP4-R1]